MEDQSATGAFFRGLSDAQIDALYRKAQWYASRFPTIPANDLAMDAMLKLTTARFRDLGGDPIVMREAFLCKTVRNLATDYVQRSPTKTLRPGSAMRSLDDGIRGADGESEETATLGDTILVDTVTPETRLIAREELDERFHRSADAAATISSAIEALPHRSWSMVMRLRIFAGKTYVEIARETGMPLGTVMSRLSRGTSCLYDELSRRGQDLDDLLVEWSPLRYARRQ